MKTFTYAAAIALLTASAAFAQSSDTGSSDTMQNMPAQNQSMSNHDMSGQATAQPSDIKGNMNAPAQRKLARTRSDRSQDARENQITMQLNRQQLAANGNMSASGMSGTGNSFDNGAPQQAQAGGANCTPDNPSCGTARDNPAINSSPQHRVYNASPE